MRRHALLVALVSSAVLVACGGGGGGDPQPQPTPTNSGTPTYTVGGAVTGLGSASGLVVGIGTNSVAVPAGATTYQLPTAVASGTYQLTLTAPAGMTCVAANHGEVIVSGANVSTADVECAQLTYTLGGTVTGMPAGGTLVLADGANHEVTVTAEGPFTFGTRLAGGTAYNVTVTTAPAGRSCTVTNGTGTITTANVENVAVSCGPATFAVGGAVRGLASTGLVITSTVPGATAVNIGASDTTWILPVRAPVGSYTLTISGQPSGANCTFTGDGTARSLTIGSADVTNADVTCVGVVLQRWAAPTTWGGAAATFWPDSDPALVQHAWFTGAGIQESKSAQWAFQGGAAPATVALNAFPAGPRFGAGPFTQEGVNYRAATADARLDLPRDMLVCAVFQPDSDPVANEWEKPIFSKGFGNFTDDLIQGGWSLMQMHESFCFHYESRDSRGLSRSAMAFIPTALAVGNPYGAGNANPRVARPPNDNPTSLPTWVVVCAGRDGDDLVIAANSTDNMKRFPLAPMFGQPPFTLDAAVSTPATIGGYTGALTDFPNSKHVFGGRVFETAVWNQPATEANVRAKLAAVQGLAAGVSYTRNRPGPFQFAGVGGGAYHVTWNNGPRIDPAKGMLFGLQSWNRVNGWMPGDPSYDYVSTFAASEDLSLWQPAGGAAVADDAAAVTPFGFARSAQRVTLPAGGSLSIPLDEMRQNPVAPAPPPTGAPPTWDSTGLVHGQIWVRVPTAQAAGSVLRVRKTDPDPRNPTFDHYDINLASLTPGEWTRVWLNGDRGGQDAGGRISAEVGKPGTLFLENGGSGAITFNAWGVDLTQIGGGGDMNPVTTLPFSQFSPDPGPAMYDWTAANDYAGAFNTSYEEDVLMPPPLTGSTAADGFCLSVDARPPDGFAWNYRLHDSRTAVAWANAASPAQVTRILRLYVDGVDTTTPGKICFGSRTLTTAGDWSTAQPETVVACGDVPAGWTPGSAHNLKACATAAGQLSIYADYAIPNPTSNTTAIASGTLTNGVPDLGTGRLLVGNGANKKTGLSTPWHGYVSAAAACRATNIAICR